jgi:hypothetical protein
MTKHQDVKAKAWKRLNKPAIVGLFPVADLSQRRDEAVNAWWRDIFEYFEVDPTGPHAWEQIAWRLAVRVFPNFKIVGMSNTGAPRTQEKVDALLELFEAYDPPDKGSKYKQFLKEHANECNASGIKSPESLKDAFSRARWRRKDSKALEEALVRFETARALGIIRSTGR